jgi:hypothetical protein
LDAAGFGGVFPFGATLLGAFGATLAGGLGADFEGAFAGSFLTGLEDFAGADLAGRALVFEGCEEGIEVALARADQAPLFIDMSAELRTVEVVPAYPHVFTRRPTLTPSHALARTVPPVRN